MDPLGWIDEDTERGPITAVREALGSKLDGLPEDLCDDLQICRFLRGNSNDVAIVAEKLSKAIDHRSSKIETESIKHLRATHAKSTLFFLDELPHAGQMLKYLPICLIDGTGGHSVDGLPIALSVPRFLDAAAFNALDEEAKSNTEEFTAAMLEMRALVLHNLSHAQKRMVKLLDVRDMTQTNIPSLIKDGRGLISRLMSMISKVQDFYPEMIHQVHIFNAPSTFSTLFSIISVILNKRMLSKIKVSSAGKPLTEFASCLDARAICSWISKASVGLDLSGFSIPNSAVEYIARWLDKGDTCKWCVSVASMDIKVARVFIPAEGEACQMSSEEAKVVPDKPYEGSFVAECSGALVLCMDNYSSWLKSKSVAVSFS